MELGEIISLVVTGALAGTAAALLLGRRSKKSGDLVRNTVIGILGALVGGFLFRALDISLPESLSTGITVADLVVAFVGAIIVILVAGLVK